MLFPSHQKGFTLVELLVAVVLLGMISTMIYSIMNVAIRASHKGEKQLLVNARQQGLLDLLHRQISSAWYDPQTKVPIISTDGDTLRVVTRVPLINRSAELVLAVYRYDQADQILYYLEKKDFYNIDYTENYQPDFKEMTALSKIESAIAMEYDPETRYVSIDYAGNQHTFYPRCANREEDILTKTPLQNTQKK